MSWQTKTLPVLSEETPELVCVSKLWPCGYTSVTASPVRLGIWHAEMGHSDPCPQGSEDLVGRHRQAKGHTEGRGCRSRAMRRLVEESERLANTSGA